MPQKILISLHGGRALPAYRFITKFQPEILHLIAASTSNSTQNLLDALPKNIKVICHNVPPYDFQATQQALSSVLAQHPQEAEFTLQSASEPKTMSFSAWDFCLKNPKQIKQFFTSTDQGEIDLFQLDKPPILASLSLSEYCQLYVGPPSIEFQKETPDYDAIYPLVQNHAAKLNSLCKKLRTLQQKLQISRNQEAKISLEKLGLNQEEQKGLNLLNRHNQIKIDRNSLILSPQTNALWLTGNWLEYYTYLAAQKNQVFDELAWNIKHHNQIFELDFMGIKDSKIFIASCKTNKLEREVFQELSARRDQLGGAACLTLLISSAPSTGQAKENQDKWSKEYNIPYCDQANLANLGQIFKELQKQDRF